MKRELTEAARAAKMIRTNLRAQGLDVKVTSSNFSMGDSVTIRMVDQPPEIRKLVDQYCGNFQQGHFNGMEDIYEYSNNRKDIPQAKFVTVNNEMTDGMREAIYQHARKAWGGGETLPETYEQARSQNVNFQGAWIDQFVWRQFSDEQAPFWRDQPKRPKINPNPAPRGRKDHV